MKKQTFAKQGKMTTKLEEKEGRIEK